MLKDPLLPLSSSLIDESPNVRVENDTEVIIRERQKKVGTKRRRRTNWAYSFAQLALRRDHLGLRVQQTTQTKMTQSLDSYEKIANELSRLQREFMQKQKTKESYEWYQNLCSVASTTLGVLSTAYLAYGASYLVASALVLSALGSLANEVLTYTDGWTQLAGYLSEDAEQKIMYASTMKTLFATGTIFTSLCAGIYGATQAVGNFTSHLLTQGAFQATSIASFFTGAGVDYYENQSVNLQADLKENQTKQNQSFADFDSAASSLEGFEEHEVHQHLNATNLMQHYAEATRLASQGA